MTTAARAQPAPAAIAADPTALAAVRLLEQCDECLAALGPGAYTSAAPDEPTGTVGRHVRHLLDHFSAIMPVLGDGEAVIDYDRRARGVTAETDLSAARAQIAGLCIALGGVSAELAARGVMIRVMLSADGDEAELRSTLGRELAFATHHALHHHAMIKTIARHAGVGALPAGFGVAPSTLHHEGR